MTQDEPEISEPEEEIDVSDEPEQGQLPDRGLSLTEDEMTQDEDEKTPEEPEPK